MMEKKVTGCINEIHGEVRQIGGGDDKMSSSHISSS